MATPFNSKQVISFKELLISQVIQQEVLTRLLVERGKKKLGVKAK
jgi:hypothetical protein